MAQYVTVANGLVTRDTSTNGEVPPLTVSGDPWIDVSGMNPRPVIGDAYAAESFTLNHTSLTAARGAKIGELRDACAQHIKGTGFWYVTTLVTAPPETEPSYYVFPSRAEDQWNVLLALAAILASEGREEHDAGFTLWCAVGQDIATATDWDIRIFIGQQIKEIAGHMQTHINDAQYVIKANIDEVFAATTVNTVNAIEFVATLQTE